MIALNYCIEEVGPAPHDEPCAKVGDVDYGKKSRIECQLFKDQILRHYPIPAGADAGVRITSNPHEFGCYREVELAYLDQEGAEWAASIEADPKGALAKWDVEARNALGLIGPQ